jgi:hypothetical protein
VDETIKEGRTIYRRDRTVSAAPGSTASALAVAGSGLPCPHEHAGAHGQERGLSAEARETLALLKQAAAER